ncbi:hypothetical protein [Trujillonella endophytica]|uniref:Uncharacterized protein n=1 Tax=Trujillonella endophytica TaxID=673521 RepID=A0A1H8SCK8_9ACTN|nr:hypothetical protein [Trujillella endophytica]SEO76460.1 hypothetical protein SAMN05660991_01606 [Trujillella endophytica]
MTLFVVLLAVLAVVSLLALAQTWSVGIPDRRLPGEPAFADHPELYALRLRVA